MATSVGSLAAAGFRGFAPDQRGYSAGARPNGVESYRTTLLIADALALMDLCARTGSTSLAMTGVDSLPGC